MRRFRMLPVTGLILLLASGSMDHAVAVPHPAAAGVRGAPPLPDTWVNGPPFSSEGVRGKVTFLVFYEET